MAGAGARRGRVRRGQRGARTTVRKSRHCLRVTEMMPMRLRRVRLAGADVLVLAGLGDPPASMDALRTGVQRRRSRGW
jgi:hypothetical protein